MADLNIFSPFQLLQVSVHPSAVGYIHFVMRLLCLEDRVRRHSRSASFAFKIRQHFFYRQVLLAAPLTCASRVRLAICLVVTLVI